MIHMCITCPQWVLTQSNMTWWCMNRGNNDLEIDRIVNLQKLPHSSHCWANYGVSTSFQHLPLQCQPIIMKVLEATEKKNDFKMQFSLLILSSDILCICCGSGFLLPIYKLCVKYPGISVVECFVIPLLIGVVALVPGGCTSFDLMSLPPEYLWLQPQWTWNHAAFFRRFSFIGRCDLW